VAEVVGTFSVLSEIRRLAPDLMKAMNKKVDVELNRVVEHARGFVTEQPPMSGWSVAKQKGSWARLAYDPEAIKDGIRKTRAGGIVRTPQGLMQTYAILNKTGAGVLYESSGTKNPGFTPQAQYFSWRIASWQNDLPVKRHHLIVRALIQDRKNVVHDIQEAIDETVRIWNARKDADRAFDPWMKSGQPIG